MTVLAEAGGVLAEEQDEAQTASVARRRECDSRLTGDRSRVDDPESAVLNLSARKKEKLLPTLPRRGSSRS